MRYRPVSQGLGQLIAAGGLLVLGGCATYSPDPLPETAPMALDLEALRAQLPQQASGRVSHQIDLADGLDLTEVV